MKNKIIVSLVIYIWTVLPFFVQIMLIHDGILGNFISPPSFAFAISVPILIQLGLKGSSLPFFSDKYKKWAKQKYSLILYRHSIILAIFLPLIFIVLCVQDAFDSASSNLGGLFAAAVLTTLYYSSFLIMLNIYSLLKQVEHKDSKTIYSQFPTLFFTTSSFLIINLMQFLLIVAISGSAFPINYIDYYVNMFSNTLLDINYSAYIIMIVSYAFYIGISFTIVNKILKITDYISLNKIILMNVPLLVLNYTISNQVYLLSRIDSNWENTDYWNEFSTFTSNTLGFSIIFLLVLFITLIIQKLNKEHHYKIEKFEFLDKTKANKIFSTLMVLFFFGGLIYMEYVEGSAVTMTFIYAATVLSLIPIYITRQKNKIDYLIQDKVKTLRTAKERTDKILFNVLPKEIASELNEKGNVMPKGFDEVSILFTDFKNFTNASSTMSPKKLVGDLNFIFHLFDEIIEQQGVEKIKTIGDAYMIASGVPNNDDNHAEKCIETGLKMIKALKINNRDKGIKWDMRIGIHSGSVVAGLVGKNRFTYDLWGDTVNIASRMESSSEANRINISGVTYDLVKHLYEFDYRGKIDVKGKGDIDMYFVNN